MCHALEIQYISTGCYTIDVSTLIVPISYICQPITKPFDSMRVKTGRICLVYEQKLVGLDFGLEKIQKILTFLDWILIANPFWWIAGLTPLDWICKSNP